MAMWGSFFQFPERKEIRFIDSLKVGWLVNKKNVRSKYTLKNMIPEKEKNIFTVDDRV